MIPQLPQRQMSDPKAIRAMASGIRTRLNDLHQAHKALGHGDTREPLFDVAVQLSMLVEELAIISEHLVDRVNPR